MPKIFIRGASRLSRAKRARASDRRVYPIVGAATPPAPVPPHPARRRRTLALETSTASVSFHSEHYRVGVGVGADMGVGACTLLRRVGSFVIECITSVES
ncbi:hypothetical protein RR46_05874 [Papilio xuthus]|uniref:Uncharacterized protein n=1 Tax=Papilio xuthus TaxID=66420 RepID=A0A194PMS7_PAPXU|nr:hypothetical protein RR46_05874 [Papilio xuthus]